MMAKDEWEPGLKERLEGDLPALARFGRAAGQYEVCALSPDRWEWRVSSKWLLAGEPISAFPNQFSKLGGKLKKVMLKLGWEYSESVRIGGVSTTGYFRREAALEAKVKHRELPIAEIEEVPAASAPDPDGLEPKARPISPGGPLATILKMPISSTASPQMADAKVVPLRPSWRRM
jgi:hypothetical protein